jgi:hypothetical protein
MLANKVVACKSTVAAWQAQNLLGTARHGMTAWQ